MIKGAVEFANYGKDDEVRRRAARDAAVFLRAFLEDGPIGKAPDPTPEVTVPPTGSDLVFHAPPLPPHRLVERFWDARGFHVRALRYLRRSEKSVNRIRAPSEEAKVLGNLAQALEDSSQRKSHD